LALGLKKETADMCWQPTTLNGEAITYPSQDVWLNGSIITNNHFPAWSLHRLLLLIPKEVNIDGYRFPLRSDAVMRLDEADDMYEYVIGVLERTIKEGYFNKEYLV
jgi:hypothetical protein